MITFVFPFCTIFLALNITVYTPSQGTNRAKHFIIVTMKEKCQLWRQMNNFPSFSSLKDHTFSIFRQKMYGPIPSDIDIQMLIPATTQ